MKAGDWIVLDENAKTFQMFPASHDFTKADTPSPSEPAESTPAESTPSESTPAESTPAESTPAASSTAPAAGDSGMLVFAVLGVLSVAGVAVALKARR